MSTYPKPYIDYLVEFHGTRDFFECHEIMEEFWKEQPDSHWLTLIQLAVAVYHERQNNFNGSLRMYEKVIKFLEKNNGSMEQLAIDANALSELVKQRVENIHNRKNYETFTIPITDNALIKQCQILCKEKGLEWEMKEDLNDHALVFRHKLRDRSDVIEERLAALEKKKKERKS